MMWSGRVGRHFLSLFGKPFINCSFTFLTRLLERSSAATAGSPAVAAIAARPAKRCKSVKNHDCFLPTDSMFSFGFFLFLSGYTYWFLKASSA